MSEWLREHASRCDSRKRRYSLPLSSLPYTLVLANTDETNAHDRELIDRVRAVPIEVLTRAGLRLDRVGIKRQALAAPPPRA